MRLRYRCVISKVKHKAEEARKRHLNLFAARLEQILNIEHPMAKLEEKIDWLFRRNQFRLLQRGHGGIGKATRLMVGLHNLKHAFKGLTMAWSLDGR
jgi:IS5 family transposase